MKDWAIEIAVRRGSRSKPTEQNDIKRKIASGLNLGHSVSRRLSQSK